MDIDKIKTGIEKLDSMLGGGIPKKHTVLFTGTAGTMKSSLAFQTIYNSAQAGINCVYVSLEQTADSILTQASMMGYDLAKVSIDSNDTSAVKKFAGDTRKKTGLLTIIDIGLIRDGQSPREQKSFSWLNEIKNCLSKKTDQKAEIFVLDSLNALLHLEQFGNTRTELFEFFKFLRSLGLTSIIIKEKVDIDTGYNPFEIESHYLADGIIQLALTKRKLSVKRELNIVKMRFADHSTDVCIFTFDRSKTKFRLSEKIAVDD